MKKLFVYIMLWVSALASVSCQIQEPMSVQMMRSEMARCPEASWLDGKQGELKWNYTTGLELKAFLDVYDTYGDGQVLDYVDAWYDAIISEDGSIFSYKISNFNVDHICPARTLLRLNELRPKDKYSKALALIRSQIDGQPRTSEGGFWHKAVYPNQMWLDGLYMAQPFYAAYTAAFEKDAAVRDSLYHDICSNFMTVAAHTYDEKTGLYRHAWDESRQMFWCDPETGQSQHAWGRALGWYCMALVDVLDYIPETFEGRQELIAILQGILAKLPEYADPETGMWYQVLDCPGREGNYVEATASSMFTYTYLKAARMGYIDPVMSAYGQELYQKLVATFIAENEDGTISLKDCCAVAGLGGKEMRDGSYEYYINEKRCSDDPKGVGPFIWASLEMERI